MTLRTNERTNSANLPDGFERAVARGRDAAAELLRRAMRRSGADERRIEARVAELRGRHASG